jgi:hypothetical protein
VLYTFHYDIDLPSARSPHGAAVLMGSASSWLNSRNLFVTSSGHLSLGLTTTQPGDEICVVLGCSVPLVVRPLADYRFKYESQGRFDWHESGEIKYRPLIGECYYHSFMDGEAVGGDNEEKQEWRMKVDTNRLV